MIIDTSAVVAILREEDEARYFENAIENSLTRQMSAASVLELSIVLRDSGNSFVDRVLEKLGVEILDVDSAHLRWARHAHRMYGRGSASPARLNFGDCLVYGAAMATGAPLLFKGDDFVHTDVRRA